MAETESRGRAVAALAERMDFSARARLKAREVEGLPVLEAALPGPFCALFTTRLGGESTGLYFSLNLDPRSKDDAATVRRNRARVVSALSALTATRQAAVTRPGAARLAGAQGKVPSSYRLISPEQAHGWRVVGAREYVDQGERGACDGLTLHPLLDAGLAPALLFADCVPVVMVGEVDAAVVHGGWRGILGGVIQQAGRAMTGPPGLAVIGPSIGPCCFEVGDEVAAAFAGRFGSGVVKTDPGASAKRRVDLWAAVAQILISMGVAPQNIVNPRLCTACHTDLFFSYRREGPDTGRQACVLWAADA